MKRTRTIAFILCVLMCVSLLAGCNGGDGGTTTPTPTPTPTPASTDGGGGTETPDQSTDVEYVEDLVILGGDKIPVINTANTAFNIAQSGWICHMVFPALIKLTSDYTFASDLATDWSSDDMQTFTFKLRDDVYFHNGEQFTADDVAYTIDSRTASPGTIAFDKLGQIESYEIVNDFEIILKLKAVNVDFYTDISTLQCGIVNREAEESDSEKGSWIGTGAWKVKEIVSNEYVVLERNEDYYGEIPVTKTITIKFVQETSVRRIMLENGEAHLAYGIDVSDYPLVEQSPDLDAMYFTLNNTAYLGFNMLDPITSDQNFRLAVAHALNRDDCVAITRSGYAVPVTSGTYWGYATEFKDESIPIYEYNTEKAKEYLELSNYNGEEVEIVGAMPDPIKNAQVIQANLQAIGINAVVFETDAPGLSSYAKWGETKHQLISYSSAWSSSATSIRTLVYPGAANNRFNYENDEVTELLDKALITIDAAEREAIYKQVQAIVAEEIPVLGLFNMTFIIAVAKGVAGINMYTNANHDFTYMHLVKE